MIKLGLALLIVLVPISAQARQHCTSRVNLLNHLKSVYGEEPTATGLTANGLMLEVIVSDKGSWTLILTTPQGVSCLLGTGQNWTQLPRRLQGALL